MYCPNCKNEYRKGIEICPSCNIALVEELTPEMDMKELFRTDDPDMAKEVGRYFEHIGLFYEINDDPDTGEAVFNVSSKEFKKAKMEASTVIKVYSENKLMQQMENPVADDNATDEDNEAVETGEEIVDEEEEKSVFAPSSEPFVSARDRSGDYRSSGILFIIMGLVILVIAVLNMAGVLGFISAEISRILMLVLGIACIAGGIASVVRSRTLQGQVSGEEELVKAVKAALNEKYPPDVFAAMMETDDTTPEIRYIQVQEEIKKAMTEAFPSASSEMLDEFIEEYTDSMFA